MTDKVIISHKSDSPVFSAVFFFIYDLVFLPLLLVLIFTLGVLVSSKIRLGLKLRREKRLRKGQLTKPIWIHASSGEFEYAKPIVRSLKETHPNIPIVVTYFSPSYAKAIENFPGVDAALPLPFDTRAATSDFIKRLDPQMLLISRTDLWPRLLSSVNKRSIPSLLFSATIRPFTGKRRLIKAYFKFITGMINDAFVVSEEDRYNFSKIEPTCAISANGDTRFDQVIHRLAHPKPIRHNLFTDQTLPLMIAGSTWPEDESPLFIASQKFLKLKQMKLIIAPHEPTDAHIDQIAAKIKGFGLSFQRYSEATSWTSDILIIDQIGILAELYHVAQFAFVGGSFKGKVHSVMEPLAAGLLTLVGPHHKNNREALSFQKINIQISSDEKLNDALRPVMYAENALEFEKLIYLGLVANQHHDEIEAFIKAEVQKRAGATRHVLSWVESHIKQ